MLFNIVLPLILLLTSLTIVLLYARYEVKVRALFEQNTIRPRDAVLMVLAMGVMVTVIAFIPQQAMMVLVLFATSLLLLLFTYVIAPRWYLAVLTPAVFLVLYFFRWNVHFSNIFAIIFVLSISILLGSLFTWRSTVAYVTLLIVMDVVQVLGTKFMVVSAERMLVLRLPTMIVAPAFPVEGLSVLGLGDILLTGLLSIQTLRRYGRKLGFASCISIAMGFFLAETILLNSNTGFFPATVMIAGSWVMVLAARYLWDYTKKFRQRSA